MKIITIKIIASNIYLIVGEKGSILIDTAIPGTEKKVLQTLKKEGLKYSDLKLIIITHGHFDHVGAVLKIKETTGANVAIHLKGNDSLEKGISQHMIPVNTLGKFITPFLKTEFKGFIPFKPDILIDQELDLTDFGIDGKVVHTPGHTEDSISIVLSTGEIFIGDMLFGGFIPAIPKLPPFAVSLKDLGVSIKKILSYSPKIIYGGHGGPFSPEYIKKLVNKNRKILS